jgi:hypothetical protein
MAFSLPIAWLRTHKKRIDIADRNKKRGLVYGYVVDRRSGLRAAEAIFSEVAKEAASG